MTRDDIASVSKAISRNPELVASATDRAGNTALHLASGGEEEVLSALLRCDQVDVNALNQTNNTPLHYFVQNYSSPAYQVPWQLFLARGVNLNARNRQGETPLHKACLNPVLRLIMVDLLLTQSNVEIDACTDQGDRAMHYAIRLHRQDLVQTLLAHGASITAKLGKLTPRELAIECGAHEISRLLRNAEELQRWLESNDMGRHFALFLRANAFMDVVPTLTDSDLEQIGVKLQGHRLKLLRASRNVRARVTRTRSALQRAAPPTDMSSAEDAHQHDVEHLLDTGVISVDDASKSMVDDDTASTETDESLPTALQSFCLDMSDLELTRLMHCGRRGERVYSALYREVEVAVKFLGHADRASNVEFLSAMKALQHVASPYIAIVIGFVQSPKPALVTELCTNGSFADIMRRQGGDTLSWRVVLGLLKEAALGLSVLHALEPHIVHGDVRAECALVTAEWHVKLTGAGQMMRKLSLPSTSLGADPVVEVAALPGVVGMTVAESTPANITAASWHILAPEVFANDAALSIKSDVFQFAFVVWEMVQRTLTHTYRRAYSEYYARYLGSAARARSPPPPDAASADNGDSAGLVRSGRLPRDLVRSSDLLNDEIDRLGLRPTIPERCPEPLQFVILRAWSKLAIDRPSAKDIAARFQDMIARYETDTVLQAMWRAAIVPERTNTPLTDDAAAGVMTSSLDLALETQFKARDIPRVSSPFNGESVTEDSRSQLFSSNQDEIDDESTTYSVGLVSSSSSDSSSSSTTSASESDSSSSSPPPIAPAVISPLPGRRASSATSTRRKRSAKPSLTAAVSSGAVSRSVAPLVMSPLSTQSGGGMPSVRTITTMSSSPTDREVNGALGKSPQRRRISGSAERARANSEVMLLQSSPSAPMLIAGDLSPRFASPLARSPLGSPRRRSPRSTRLGASPPFLVPEQRSSSGRLDRHARRSSDPDAISPVSSSAELMMPTPELPTLIESPRRVRKARGTTNKTKRKSRGDQ